MRVVRPAREPEVVVAFLRAEVNSKRFGEKYATAGSTLVRAMIETPDLENEQENRIRAELLHAVRGYRNQALFAGFPIDVKWELVEVGFEELADFRYSPKMASWMDLSRGSGLVRVAADNVSRGDRRSDAIMISSIAEDVRNGTTYPELVAVRRTADEPPILLEGYARATAYVAAGTPSVTRILLGTSESLNSWHWYGPAVP